MRKFAIILSGCGVFDGAEIHEATLTMLAIAKQGAEYEIFAPNIEQHHVINHLTGKEMNEKRNVLTESARIARGNIKNLSDFSADKFDALIMPGGFGVAKNLSDFATKADKCTVNKEVEQAILQIHKQNKPIGALCISPVIVAKVLKGAKVTIGNDRKTGKIITQMGATNIETNHGEVTIDNELKIFTTPCYMLDATITDIAEGAENIVKEMLNMLNRL